MAVYQDKAKDRIKNGLRRMQRIVAKGYEGDYNEADTRKIVSVMLSDLLGWDRFDEVTSEQMIGSRYADFVIRTDDSKEGEKVEELAVVEVKKIGLALKETHLNQARQYATDEGIEWIILTNGDDWNVYRMVMEGSIPTCKPFFSMSISNSDMRPAEKTELLYLLSHEAHRKNEIADYYDRKVSLSGGNLADTLLEQDVLDKIRLTLKKRTGQRFEDSEIAYAMLKNLFSPDVVDDDHYALIKKLEKSEK